MNNKKPPLVTILIPAYNHAAYIEECILSVLNQTYDNLEIIIINDGSTDDTESVIKNVIDNKNSISNIEYYSQDNQGVCKTLNRGIKLAEGKYIASIASDDVWVTDKIEKQVDFLEKNNDVGLVFTDTFFIHDQSKASLKHTDYKPEIKKYFLNGIQNVNIHNKLLYDCFIPAVSVMMRKDCLDIVGYYDEELKSEDYNMWLRFTMLYPIGFIDEPLAYQRKHDNNASNNALSALPEVAKIVHKNYKKGSLKNRPLLAIYVFFAFFIKATINRIKRKILFK